MGVVYAQNMSDFPDWQQFPNAQSDNLFPSFQQVLTPGLHSTPILPALSWSSLFAAITPQAGAGQFQVNHFADAAGTQQIDADTWKVNTATRCVVRTPLRGKFARLDLTVTSGGNMTVNNWANFLSASSDRVSFPVSNQNLSAFGFAVPPSGSAHAESGEIAAGLAYFYLKPYDATGKLYVAIHAVDEFGTAGQLIADFGTPTATIDRLITVPDVIIQVKVDNLDGAAPHTFDFSLTIPPQ